MKFFQCPIAGAMLFSNSLRYVFCIMDISVVCKMWATNSKPQILFLIRFSFEYKIVETMT